MQDGSALVPALVYSPPTTLTVFENNLANIARYYIKIHALDPRSLLTADLIVKVKVFCIRSYM